MSMLNSTSDFSSTPIAFARSIKVFARGFFRAINNAVAAIIARREYHANLAILRSFTDRELRDIGLDRSQYRRRHGRGRQGSCIEPAPPHPAVTVMMQCPDTQGRPLRLHLREAVVQRVAGAAHGADRILLAARD